jgi:hypothetical protein
MSIRSTIHSSMYQSKQRLAMCRAVWRSEPRGPDGRITSIVGTLNDWLPSLLFRDPLLTGAITRAATSKKLLTFRFGRSSVGVAHEKAKLLRKSDAKLRDSLS